MKTLDSPDWSAVAKGYQEYWAPRLRPFMLHALDRFEPAERGPLAVVGCGSGEEVVELARRRPDRAILATDAAREMVVLARRTAREAGIANAVITQGDAAELEGSVRQAAGVFSAFVLQLLPDPIAALRSWAAALRLGGRVGAIYWPPPDPGTPYARLVAAVALVTGEARKDWIPDAERSLEGLGLALTHREDVAFEMAHASPQECIDRLFSSGPLHGVITRHGQARADQVRAAWLADHGLEHRDGKWRQSAKARLWVLEKTREAGAHH